MNIQLIGIHSDLVSAWQKVFAGVADVTVIHGSVFDHPCDALVSPANSFGYMNGGIDFLISKHLGWHVEKRLQQQIRDKFYGELLVGQAAIVETDSDLFPYLISAPTMRNPMTIRHTPNPYLAMKAVLVLVKYGKLADGTSVSDRVKTIAVPGLGTGVGQVPPMVCARQMRLAWEDVMQEKHKTIEGWKEIGSNFAYFFTHNPKDIKYDIP